MKEIYKSHFAFFVDVKKSIGIGHLKRLKILEKKLKTSNITWVINGDKHIIKKFFARNSKKLIINCNYKKKNLVELKKRNISKIVFDIAHDKNLKKNKLKYIYNFFKKKGFKTISFDVPIYKLTSDISIIPYNYPLKKIKKNENTKLFLGNYYFINNINAKIKKINKIKKVLICISGTDPKNISFKIYQSIKKLNYKFNVFLGKNNNSQKLKKQNNFNNVTFYKMKKDMLKEIKKNDAIICGEGLLKYESILSYKPTIIIHQKDISSIMIKNFIKLKVCQSFGIFEKINKNSLANNIEKYFENINAIKQNLKNILKNFSHKRMNSKQIRLFKTIKNL